MDKLSIGQKKVITDFLSTTAAAWFAAGVIAPIFSTSSNADEVIISIISGLSTACILMFISTMIMKGVNI